MRSLVSYDDIATEPPDQVKESSGYAPEYGSPPKKRRRNNRQGQKHRSQDEEYRGPPKQPRKDHEIKEESRQLSHEEIWDDSALIHAWDAAIEEYKVLNGPEKKWKTEPVNKSALWYNIPPQREESPTSPGTSFLMPSIPVDFAYQVDSEDQEVDHTDPENSKPTNFETFVPRHDPGLSHINGTKDGQSRVANGTDDTPYPCVIPPAPSVQVTRDEAFQQAIGAWYWAGYWTGIYHSTGSSAAPNAAHIDEHENREVAMDSPEDVQEKDLAVDGASSDEDRAEEKDLIPT